MEIKEGKNLDRNKGRLIAGIIFLTPIVMLVFSTMLYYSGFSPDGTTNNGELIDTKVGMSSKDDLIQWLEKYI